MVEIHPLSIAEITDLVSGKVLSKNSTAGTISALGEPQEVRPDGAAFIISEAYVKEAASTQAKVLVVQEALVEKVLPLLSVAAKNTTCIISSPDAYLGLAKVTAAVATHDPIFDWPYSPDRVHLTAKVDASSRIDPSATIGADAIVGARTVIMANAVVGPRCRVGSDCILFPGAVLYPRTELGNRVRLHANAVLGSDGFGYAKSPTGASKIWHLGRVIIQDDVEIGPGTTIDRGTLKDTIIEKGVKIDNQVQIGHNGHVMPHALLCSQVGLAGNVTVGPGAILAGKVGIADKITIGAGAIVGALSGVSKDVAPREEVMAAFPSRPRREWWRLVSYFERLPELTARVKKLESDKK